MPRTGALIVSAIALLSTVTGCSLGGDATEDYRPDPDAGQVERIIIRSPGPVETGLPYTDPPLTANRPLDANNEGDPSDADGGGDSNGGGEGAATR